MISTRIGLIRHGETLWNKLGRWQGHAAVPLNAEGLEQAARLADYLQPQAAQITAIYSSDLSRASVTAQAIGRLTGHTVEIDPRLREVDIGDWQGLTAEEIRAWDADRWDYVYADPYNHARPNGESLRQLADRAEAAIMDYVGQHSGGFVLAVSHGGTIRILLERLGLIADHRMIIENTSLSIICHEVGSWRLETLNSVEHLGARPTVVGGNEGRE